MTEAVLPPCGVILAGGQSRRMGGAPKALRELAGMTLLQRVMARAQPQVQALLINSNQPLPPALCGYLPQLADSIGGFAGPLAGIVTAMEWTQQHYPQCQWLATFAVDTPFIPTDLVQTLLQATTPDSDVICPSFEGRRHPLCGLWRTATVGALRTAITSTGLTRVYDWLDARPTVNVAISADADPFLNINTPAELALATQRLAPTPSTTGKAG